jgi:dihydrofolate reductase
MRRIIFQQFLSLDGLAADAEGRTKFFESPEYAAVSDEDLLAEMQHFDTILLGANTYKMFADFWPAATNDEQIVADKLNSIPKIVFSNTLQSAPWGKWPAARIESGDAVEAVRQLKQQPGGNMVLWGSISLSQALMNARLIDEFHFRIVPLILGKGRSNFDHTNNLDLTLNETKRYDSGLILLKYLLKA